MADEAEAPPAAEAPAEAAPVADVAPAEAAEAGETAAAGDAAAAEPAAEGEAPPAAEAEGGEGGDAAAPAAEAEEPAAAAPELRPNTAGADSLLGAAEIEGFDEDFLEEQFEEKELPPEEEEDDDDAELDRIDLEQEVQEAQDEHDRLAAANAVMQRKLLPIVTSRKAVAEVRDTGKLGSEGQESRYLQSLANWVEMTEETERVERHYELQLRETQARLEERDAKADDIRKAFRNFKLEVARSSENSRTGKPISEKVIQEKMAQELKKEKEVERVRLKNIHLRNQLRKLEASLKQKEELTEGLHLIDFEQLKIENQSLNEKIEERNEELLKLRKKTTMTVQVLTHLKEKLQFVQKENEVVANDLEELERSLTENRDSLQRLKHDRDVLRAQNAKLKSQSGLVTNDQLIEDIEVQKERRDALVAGVEKLRARHITLMDSLQIARSTLPSTAGAPSTGGFSPQVTGQIPAL